MRHEPLYKRYLSTVPVSYTFWVLDDHHTVTQGVLLTEEPADRIHKPGHS